MVGVLTVHQRVAPVIEAVLAQIKLNSDLYHTFMDILQEENSVLANIIQQSYSKYNYNNTIDGLLTYR